MGKRSRKIARRRTRNPRLDELIQAIASRELHVLEFCRMAAEFADRRAHEGSRASNAIKWISENGHMTEEDAADSIAIGRRLIARAPQPELRH